MVAGVDPHEPIWTTGHRRSLGGVDIGIGTSALRQTYTDVDPYGPMLTDADPDSLTVADEV